MPRGRRTRAAAAGRRAGSQEEALVVVGVGGVVGGGGPPPGREGHVEAVGPLDAADEEHAEGPGHRRPFAPPAAGAGPDRARQAEAGQLVAQDLHLAGGEGDQVAEPGGQAQAAQPGHRLGRGGGRGHGARRPPRRWWPWPGGRGRPARPARDEATPATWTAGPEPATAMVRGQHARGRSMASRRATARGVHEGDGGRWRPRWRRGRRGPTGWDGGVTATTSRKATSPTTLASGARRGEGRADGCGPRRAWRGRSSRPHQVGSEAVDDPDDEGGEDAFGHGDDHVAGAEGGGDGAGRDHVGAADGELERRRRRRRRGWRRPRRRRRPPVGGRGSWWSGRGRASRPPGRGRRRC